MTSPLAAEPRGRVILTGGGSLLTGLPTSPAAFWAGRLSLGRPLGIAGLPDGAKGPAFAVAAGLLVYPQVAHLEHFEPRHTRQLPTGRAATSPGSDDGCARASDATRNSHTDQRRPVAVRHATGTSEINRRWRTGGIRQLVRRNKRHP